MNISSVVDKTANRLRDARRVMRHTLSPHPGDVQLLSMREQLERFLKMSSTDIQNMRRKWGDAQAEEYLKIQIGNFMRNQQNVI